MIPAAAIEAAVIIFALVFWWFAWRWVFSGKGGRK